MSKKMKRVASGSSPYGLTHQDARDVSKHQILLEEFQELQKETDGMRNKLELMKQKKSILSAEVRFLRRRYKYLLTKSSKPPKGKELVQPQILASKGKNTTKAKPPKGRKVEANQHFSAMVSDVKHKGRISVPKDLAHRSPSPPVLDLNQKVRMINEKEATLGNTAPMFEERLYGDKEASFRSPNSILDLNRQGTGLYSRKGKNSQKPALAFDLNEVERAPVRREDVGQSRAPIFDLNQAIMGEEEESEDNYEPLQNEGPNNKLLIRNKADDEQQNNDLILSACRNVGSGPSRTEKRKISWQDQMALKV